jgi:2-dehydro-3-deoxyphosphogluconate aldolase/(4S)-4-hydroxy-2-oxoglutarate aldolase
MNAHDVLALAPVMPVLTIEREEDAAPLARALVAGGLRAVEITLRTPAALAAIARVAREVPEAMVGAGTVLNAADMRQAIAAGARFALSPGLPDDIPAPGAIPFIPGVATASEIMRGLAAGFTAFKFFPAAQLGGPGALAAFAGPLAQARFCPTGGVSAQNAADYLALPNVVCVGGSWVAPAEAVRAGDWARITALAAAAAGLGRR